MPLNWYKYMRRPLKLFPDDIIQHYNLQEKALNGYVYMEIQRGMYRLPQAGILANKLLQKRLDWHGYFEVQHTPGLWKHISRPVWFNLCVDDFGVKYIGDENLKHLFQALRTETYEVVEDWAGEIYCGITLDWNYAARWVDIAMPVYAIKNLTWYNHPPPLKPQHYPYTKPNFVRKRQSSTDTRQHQSTTWRCRQTTHTTNWW